MQSAPIMLPVRGTTGAAKAQDYFVTRKSALCCTLIQLFPSVFLLPTTCNCGGHWTVCYSHNYVLLKLCCKLRTPDSDDSIQI